VRPVAEESPTLQVRWKRPEHRSPIGREEAVCDLRDGQIGTDALKVDADIPTKSDGEEGESAGVGHVEVERIRVRVSGKGRLPVLVVAKREAGGWPVQVAAEDGPENSTADDEVLAVSCEMEALRPGPFLRIEVPEETLNP